MSQIFPKELKCNNLDLILAAQNLVDITVNYFTPSDFLTKENGNQIDQKSFNKSE